MGTGRVLTGVGLAAIFAAVVVALLANTSNPPSGQSASPELRVLTALAGTPITDTIRGPAARTAISRLHGRTIAGVDALVARYQDGSTLWINVSPSALEASRLMWRMNRRLAGGTRDFSAPRPQDLRGRTVFVTEGLGQVHYYYQSGTRVLWLAVPRGPHAEAALRALLAQYP